MEEPEDYDLPFILGEADRLAIQRFQCKIRSRIPGLEETLRRRYADEQADHQKRDTHTPELSHRVILLLIAS